MSDIVWKDEAAWFHETGRLPDVRIGELVAKHGNVAEGEKFVAVDIALNAPPVAVVGTKLPDGGFSIEVEHNTEAINDLVQSMVRAEMQRRIKRNDDFLRDLLRVTDYEYSVLANLHFLQRHTVAMSARGNGKKLRAEVANEILKRMDAPLPVNFWNTVEAHSMLEDKEGRKLVADIIARKVGCDVERSSD